MSLGLILRMGRTESGLMMLQTGEQLAYRSRARLHETEPNRKRKLGLYHTARPCRARSGVPTCNQHVGQLLL